ncbi:MAG: tyrosine-type recombinase/integrase [Bacteroidota bacterium]
MATRVKYFIETKRKITPYEKNNGEVNIRIRLTNGRKLKTTALTRQQVNPNFWNNDRGEVRQVAAFKDKVEFQRKLDDLRYFIKKEFDAAPDQTFVDHAWLNQTIDKFYNPDKYIGKGTTLFGFIKNFIQNAPKRINPKTGKNISYKVLREYAVTFDYLKKYAKLYGEPDFCDIDMDFYNNFVSLLRDQKLKTNTIGHKIDTLKTFLNEATEKGINTFMIYKNRNFKSLSEESHNVYLSEDEILMLNNYDFSDNERLERVRDIFVVECWTGLRFSDVDKVKIEKIDDGLMTIKQGKTGDSAIIPIHPFVNSILKKYGGRLPEQISNQKFNVYLKELAEIVGINQEVVRYENTINGDKEVHYKKYKLITSHTARRSFCTNAYKMGVPILAIMAISGHKSEKAFLKYIKLEQEEHARMALNLWKQRYQKEYEFAMN